MSCTVLNFRPSSVIASFLGRGALVSTLQSSILSITIQTQSILVFFNLSDDIL